MNKSLVWGVAGQDGSYLSELLLSLDYQVYGVIRRTSTEASLWRINHLSKNPNFHLIEGDITDAHCVNQIQSEVKPDEIYNLAAQSHVGTSFKQPQYTFNTIVNGTLNVLEWLRLNKGVRFFHAGSSEMFGSAFSCGYNYYDDDVIEHFNDKTEAPKDIKNIFQNEDTPFMPCSPYACAKLAAHKLVDVYRKSYGLFACSAITFNHESYRRGEKFVTKKITQWFAKNRLKILSNLNNPPKLELGYVLSCRDWMHAKDAVKAFHLMMQNKTPKDYIVATGQTYSIEHFLHKVIHVIFRGTINPEILYKTNIEEYMRPLEVNYLNGDSSLIRKELGWSPTVDINGLIEEMVQYDLQKYNWGQNG